ncbi:hypothetical protein GYMLUDRAFT_248367 [Collybiopsis luxurians FD-317 M1]|uniref:Uncharacterized protein n=1 Tax=Collybiopsis luxurians FD-317 M1 TaxID=944289 RepID=A0A0D0CCE9_9AGAR|nr:hypothetical protein GYMLUDRAFT_248367 [Collybiopsis luxurians FD-317 M1]
MAQHWLILYEGKYVGRPLDEDQSNKPKPIKLLPYYSRQDEIEWVLDGDDTNGFTASIRDAPTAPGPPPEPDDKVFALLNDPEKAEKWYFQPVPEQGEHRYIILTNDQSETWVAPEEEGSQILCEPVTAPYLPQAIFEIKKAE